MASYNKVILMGNLTRDPELKYLPSGTAVAKLGLAVSRTYTDRQSGEKKEEVCFVDLEAWGKTAEAMNEYLSKGRPVLIEGHLRYRTWETDEGQKRSKHEVFVERFEFVGSRQDSEGGAIRDQKAESAAPDEPPTTADDIPF
ncbi:single-stranded DNA-binding protein [Candidatus Poribacteria bacterium]|nr:single-stranded DNA-binding protein [Candidatus Poribacteria bacterium]